ncbi:MAG: glycosyltransferase family 2 protein [Sedimentisphaerales bacterium]|nr:glycosyltransferase family 2 protein [Sedimentisphaerales bacterium]
MNKQTVSVIIPAYNAADCITEAIQSILTQSHIPEEIIVVDDGSIDATAEMVRNYPSVHYIYQSNAGAAKARNTGILAATGSWIALLDADDRWLPHKLHRQLELTSTNPKLLWVYSNFWIHDQGNNNKVLAHNPEVASEISGKTDFFSNYLHAYSAGIPVQTLTLMIQRQTLLDIDMFDPDLAWAQDADLALRLAYRYPKVGYIADPLAWYEHRRQGSIASQNRSNVELRCNFITRHLQLSQKHGCLREFQPCATRLLQRWIREISILDPKADTGRFIRDFADLLPRKLRMELCFRRRFGRLGSWCVDKYFQVKNRKYHKKTLKNSQ